MPSDKEILRAIWLKAHKEKSISITYPSKAEAFSMRMRLYGLLKSLRKHPASDPELWSAYTQCEACLEELPPADFRPLGSFSLVIRRKDESPVLQAALDQLNLTITESDPLDLPDESDFLKRLTDS